MIYPSLPELLRIAERVLGPDVKARDLGLLEAALARPQTSAFGADAYPTLDEKAAALLHSLARNHALIDGNKRLALSGVVSLFGAIRAVNKCHAWSGWRFDRPERRYCPSGYAEIYLNGPAAEGLIPGRSGL